jgi:type II secretory pathway pseudopilin PulG
MRVSLQFRRRASGANRNQQGYMLLMMMLFVTLMAIAAAALAPSLIFNIKRDREQELIHRGVQYSRAIRNYVKKFGRYPTRLEDLENTNNLRFLRKRYKDPVTGKDFRLLHMGDVQTTFSAGLAGAAAAGAAAGLAGGLNGTVNVNSLAAASTGFQAQAQQQQQAQASAEQPDSGEQQPGQEDTNSQHNSNQNQPGLSGFSNQTFGGGPIVGVASPSKDKTIREFNKKNHYNQWQFIYDPTSDRGGLISTPYQPPIQLNQQNLNQNGGAAGTNQGTGGVQPSNPGNTPAPPQ